MAKKNIGVRELSRRRGFSISSISGWRTGKEMKERQILAVCEELDITPNQLLLDNPPGDELEQEIAELTEVQRKALLIFIAAMKKGA